MFRASVITPAELDLCPEALVRLEFHAKAQCPRGIGGNVRHPQRPAR